MESEAIFEIKYVAFSRHQIDFVGPLRSLITTHAKPPRIHLGNFLKAYARACLFRF